MGSLGNIEFFSTYQCRVIESIVKFVNQFTNNDSDFFISNPARSSDIL